MEVTDELELELDVDEADEELGGVKLSAEGIFLMLSGVELELGRVGLTFSKKFISLRSGNRIWSLISTILAFWLLGCCFLVCFWTSHFQLLAYIHAEHL